MRNNREPEDIIEDILAALDDASSIEEFLDSTRLFVDESDLPRKDEE